MQWRERAAMWPVAILASVVAVVVASDGALAAPRDPSAARARRQLTPAVLAEIKQVAQLETFGNLTASRQASESREAEGTRNGTVFVLVGGGIYQDIKESIALYTLGLSFEGLKTDVYAIGIAGQGDPSHDNVKNLKSFIRSRWLGLLSEPREGGISISSFDLGTGVVLIGDLPLPELHRRKGEWTKEQPEGSGNFVTGCYEGVDVQDIYLTDMDGDWSYTDDDGYIFYSTVDPDIIPVDSETVPGDETSPKWTPSPKLGNAGARPEIWLGRIDAGPVSLVNGQRNKAREVELLNEYFARVRAYRHRYYPYVTEGVSRRDCAARDRLAYYDDDWAGSAQVLANCHQSVWPGPLVHNDDPAPGPQPVNRYVDDHDLTAKQDYVQRLTGPRYLWFESLMHSNWNGHEFQAGGQTEWLSNATLNGQQLKALFYCLQGCHTCDPRHNGNLGSIYLFPGEALAVVGNTVVGPHDTGIFFECLQAGMNLGQALMMNERGYARTDNWNQNRGHTPGKIDPKRYYHQTILGDPTLRPVVFIPRPRPEEQPIAFAPGYAQILQKHPFGTTGNLSRLQSTVYRRFTAEQPGKFKPIRQMPERGIDIVPLDPEKPVIDPLWQVSANPQLRLKFDAFQRNLTLQALPQLRFNPRVRLQQ